MKTLFGFIKTTGLAKKAQGISLLLLLAIIFASCGDGQRQARKVQEEQLKEAKEDAEVNIRQIKNDLGERIAYLEDEIEEASGDLKEELKEARSELKKQRSKLDKELTKIQEATMETWNDALAEASKTLENTTRKRNEVSKKVRELLD